jgi:dephospho-CoA kinase
MLQIGLTGGIASGKSLVARVWKNLGAHVIDADLIVHDLLASDGETLQEVVGLFGPGILAPDGGIDRRRLGEVVFNDPEKRKQLNDCLHPRVFQVYSAQTRRVLERDPGSLIALDAALLIETGYHRVMDRIVVVFAEPEQQLERLMARDSFTREQALARIASQLPLADKRRQADYVIDNTGSRENTGSQAEKIFRTLLLESEKA